MNDLKLFSFCGSSIEIPNSNDVLTLYAKLQYNYIEIDRFGYLNQFSNWNLGQSDNFFNLYSNMSNSDEKFIEIFYNQIEKIIDRIAKENLKIYVSWSGGVDSSAIVCGLLSMLPNKNNLVILHTKDGILEFPLLYDILVKNNINCIDLENDRYAETYISSVNDGLLVTGWCADQLFGSVINQKYPEYFNKNYKDWIKIYATEKELDYIEIIEQCERAFEYYELPVKTFPEWSWFMNFAVKWNYVKINPFSILGKYSNRVINFFDTIDFQKWSLNNFGTLNVLNQTIPSEYKLPLKKIIENYTKDNNYTKNKGKIGSWYYLSKAQNIIKIALLDNEGYKFIHPNQHIHINRKYIVEQRLIKETVKSYERIDI